VVSAELGVGAVERRVSVGLGLLDTVCANISVHIHLVLPSARF
jgi:hypothetical protein